jgi:hypothetical protein
MTPGPRSERDESTTVTPGSRDEFIFPIERGGKVRNRAVLAELGEGISREVKNGEAEGDKIEEGEDTAAPHTKASRSRSHTEGERGGC